MLFGIITFLMMIYSNFTNLLKYKPIQHYYIILTKFNLADQVKDNGKFFNAQLKLHRFHFHIINHTKDFVLT